MLSFDGDRLILRENTPGTAQYSRETHNMFGQPDSSEIDITPCEDINQHAAIIANFVEAIANGAELIAPATEGINSLAIANAILWSAWSGEGIKLPLDSLGYQKALNEKLAMSSLRQKADIELTIDMEASYQ